MTISVLRVNAGLWDSVRSGLAVSGQVHLELFPCAKVVHLTCAILNQSVACFSG